MGFNEVVFPSDKCPVCAAYAAGRESVEKEYAELLEKVTTDAMKKVDESKGGLVFDGDKARVVRLFLAALPAREKGA